jgi:LmeA-like phospholipid-binding
VGKRHSAAAPARRIRGRLRILLAIGLALCVVGVVAAEVVARNVIDGRITADARKDLTGPVSVGIGATPALVDAVTGHISQVTIHAPSTTMCNLPDVSATATLSDVHRADGGAAAEGVSAEVTLTTQTFTALLRGNGKANATVTADPASGDLQIDLGPGGILQIQETARLTGNTLEFSPASVSLLGRPAPQAITDQITSKLTIRRQLTGLPLNLTPKSVAITSDGVQIGLKAGPTTVSGAGGASAHGCLSAA